MVAPRVLILRAPGTNCDVETEYAFQQAGAEAVRCHVNRLIEEPSLGNGFQILCLPGGFSYGDDIAAGRILAQRLQVHLQDLIEQFRNQDRLVLGICNGFQVMMRLGIFFADDAVPPPATLAENHQGRFEDRWVHLRSANSNSIFLRDVDELYLPIAHAEGRFVARDADTLARLNDAGQLGLRYAKAGQPAESTPLDFPDNPNGSQANVAGISDPSGRIFGLMPHPERHIDPTHHPSWTRRQNQPEHGEGLIIFQNAVRYFGD